MKRNWKTYLLWIALAEGVGAVSGWLTREGTEIYQQTVLQPSFAPPPLVFPVVWGILYALMGIGAARIWMSEESGERARGLRLYGVQLFMNFLWSIFFFNFQAYGFSFIWLLLLLAAIVLMTLSFYKTDKISAYLQIPYILWVSFAAYLNYMVWMLNG